MPGWYLYGSAYDLRPILAWHPGGKEILQRTLGQADITPLFESYHQFAAFESIHAKLEEHVVERACYEQLYTFEPNGFYKTVTRRAREYFESRGRANVAIKGQGGALCTASLLVLALVSLSTVMRTNLFAALVFGYLFTCVGFVIMHDASHAALFKSARANAAVSQVWNLGPRPFGVPLQ